MLADGMFICRSVPDNHDGSGVRRRHARSRRRIGRRTQVRYHVTTVTPAITTRTDCRLILPAVVVRLVCTHARTCRTADHLQNDVRM